MKKYTILFLLIIGSLSSTLAQSSYSNIFVDQDWLERNRDTRPVILLHVGTVEDFNTGHIEGAQLISSSEFSTTRGKIRWEVPAVADFNESLERHGVTDETINILYYGSGVFAPTFRLYFTMKYYGLGQNTFILDGGMPGWIASKKPVSISPSEAIEKGSVTLVANTAMLIDKVGVLERMLNDSTRIIDARNDNYYSGEEDGDGYYKRSGHIPKAVNITWTTLLDNNRFLKPEQELRQIFANAGIRENSKVITYCHVGLRATVLFTISELLGFQAQLYDGSFNEWDTLSDDYPVEKGRN